jgi:ABC-type phosphate transport system substrate-binding protein
VAGGTSFPYHITVGGKLLRNLRLSGPTLAKIFTNQITNWSDPAITADNNGRKLPSIPIIPVVHSEGSGSTAQFTRYLDTVHPTIWRPFGGDGLTEYYPRKGAAIAQNGSDGVMNFIAAASGNGSIGYDDYSYALGKNYPVAKILNAGGYYTLPNQYNVAVALAQAQINQDKSDPNKYLLQNLDKVYTYKDKRTYPLSSYSYMIIPTAGDDARMNTASGRPSPTTSPTRCARARRRWDPSGTPRCPSTWCGRASSRPSGSRPPTAVSTCVRST